jgi:hypothetical protein
MVSSTQDLPIRDVKHGSTVAEISPVPYFDPDPANALVTSQNSFLGQSTPSEVKSIADTSDQPTILEAKQMKQESLLSNSTLVSQVDEPREDPIQPDEIVDFDRSEGASKTHDFDIVAPDKPGTPAENSPLESAATLPRPDVETYISPEHTPATDLPDRNVPASSAREQGPLIYRSNEKVKKGPSPEPKTSISPNPTCSGPSEPTKRHTNRELARIALVCANGAGMSAVQITEWLASTFSYLKKGQGAWEKSLKSVLSLQPEFRSEKPAESTPEARVLYSLANAAVRVKYEQEYQSYLPPASVPGPQEGRQKARKSTPQCHGVDTVKQFECDQSGLPSQIKSSITKAVKSAPSQRTVPTHDSLPKQSMSEVTSNDEPRYNPFERTTAPRPKIAPLDDLEAERETSLRSVYPLDMAPSVETMTPEEKAAKIAEIKARPSRKQFFGSNWRLAHVRRYGRQDIHDESDGAWRSGHESVTNDCDENRSLLQVFNLPSNARPFSDGNELAFRDSTLVSDGNELAFRDSTLVSDGSFRMYGIMH